MTPGRASSEHAKALRAELFGYGLVLAGVVLGWLQPQSYAAIAMIAAGAACASHATAAYAASRGAHKAAAARPRVQAGPGAPL